MLRCVALCFIFAICVKAFGSNCGISPKSPNFPRKNLVPSEVPENLRMAYFGDLGFFLAPRDVLQMIREFGAEFLVHEGDFDYISSPSVWDSLVTSVLGEEFPYFAVVGNHELNSWDGSGGYYERLLRRAESSNITEYCTGEFGVNMACYYKGILFVLSGVGTLGTGHEEFIQETFSTYPAAHKVCNWHKNQRLFQIESKSDDIGWEAFEICNSHGAMIVDGHGHSYARTFRMSSYFDQIIDNGEMGPVTNPLIFEPGKTIHVLTGLGGIERRTSEEQRHLNPWWANYTARDVGSLGVTSNYGALLCIYNIDGSDLNKCEQVGRNGFIFDEFYFRSAISQTIPTKHTPNKCIGKRITEQVKSAQQDVTFTKTGGVDCSSNTLNTKHGVAFQIDNLDIEKNSEIEYAFLEVYGADHSPGGNITIQAELEPNLLSCASSANSKHLSASIDWVDSLNDWDKHDVWVSPDITSVVSEIVTKSHWKRGSSMTFHLKSDFANVFTSFDANKCTAPGIVVQLKGDC